MLVLRFGHYKYILIYSRHRLIGTPVNRDNRLIGIIHLEPNLLNYKNQFMVVDLRHVVVLTGPARGGGSRGSRGSYPGARARTFQSMKACYMGFYGCLGRQCRSKTHRWAEKYLDYLSLPLNLYSISKGLVINIQTLSGFHTGVAHWNLPPS